MTTRERVSVALTVIGFAAVLIAFEFWRLDRAPYVLGAIVVLLGVTIILGAYHGIRTWLESRRKPGMDLYWFRSNGDTPQRLDSPTL